MRQANVSCDQGRCRDQTLLCDTKGGRGSQPARPPVGDGRVRLMMGGAAFVLACAGFGHAMAGEQAAATTDQGSQASEVVVTGTRLRNPNLASSSPISTISPRQIELSGDRVSIDKVLNELPQFAPTHTANSITAGDQQLISTADLRGLGPQRTLVLVDGARYVPANTANQVDLNTIPASLIQRVDVVTGGASAVYGSDAIAGVVNFIMNDHFQGVEARSSVKASGQGDGLTWDAGVTAGGNFADGRGNIVADVTYSKRDSLLAGARNWANYELQSGTCAAGSVHGGLHIGAPFAGPGAVQCYQISGSGTLPAGTLNNNITFDQQGNAIYPRPPGLLENFYPYDYLQIPLNRVTGSVFAHYDLTNKIQAYGRFVYTNLGIAQNLDSTSTATTQFPPVQINYIGNPYVTPSLAALLAGLDPGHTGIATVSLARRMLELGPRTVSSREDAFQTQAGVRGDLAGTWKFDAYLSYGQDDRTDTYANDTTVTKLQQSLLATTDASGHPVCTNPANGCVPADIYGAGNVSPAAVAFLRTNELRYQQVAQTAVSSYLSGDTTGLFTLPAGPVGLVAGVEFRKLQSQESPDGVLQTASVGYTRQLPTAGGYSVKEFYGETDVPLLANMALAKSLVLKGAVRYSDYSLKGVGGVVTWNAGAIYEPIDGLRLRGEFQHAIRAPNVQELYSGVSQTTILVNDPCSNRSSVASRTPQVAALCMATGVPAADVFGNLQPGSPEIGQLSGGNPNLQAEASDTYTVGGTFRPSYLKNFVASLDYYDINIRNAVGLFGGGAANILNLCYYTVQNANSVYCKAIVRDPITGAPLQAIGNYANVAIFKTSGFDMELQQAWDLNFGLRQHDSRLSVDWHGTYVEHMTSQSELGSNILTCAGLYGSVCGEPQPHLKMITDFNWTSGSFGVDLRWRYIGETEYAGQYTFANPVRGIAASYTPSPALNSKIPVYNYLDIVLQWRVRPGIAAVFGVNNLFGADPPNVAENAPLNNTYPNTYDILGRQFFVSLNAKM